MPHIAFFVLPVPGHMNPSLGVAEELVARGHRVTYALPEAPEDIAGRAKRVGAEVVTYPMDQERFRAHMVPQQNSDEYTDKGEILRILQWLLEMTDETVEPLERSFREDRPDVIVNDPSSFWTGRILADRWGIPVIRSTPTYAANEHWSMQPDAEAAGLPDDPALLSLVGGIDQLLRAQGMDEDAGTFTGRIHGGPALLYMPRHFQYAGETFDDQHHFVGPCAPRASLHGTWEPPGDGRPLVMVSMGTLYNKQPDFFRACVEAFRDEPWNVLLVLGGGLAPEDLGALPDNVQVRDFVPLAEVFPHTALVVNHGGLSTAMEAFSYGVPVLAVPVMTEPRATARRIAELGLGAQLPPKATAADLRATARRVLADDGIRDRLRQMRERIRTAGGATAAATVVEELLPAPS
ncbi:macrolide family glycosyltransferase [Streptomyces chryseus]|uniref:macrolide family glycosyltransferase n=2 Tax=Streptomyces chryseus TaxID=68186 RepID=UPI00142F2330|nr:macrolide family glycosyltransferase [Streptomyces chryseus]